MPRFALASLLLLALASPGSAQELTVQRRWSLAAVGLDVHPRLDLERVLRDTERALRRELPDLDIRFAERTPRLRLPAGLDPTALNNRKLARVALRLAEEAGLAVAEHDVVFVFTPHTKRYFGLSHLEGQDRRGRPARAALIQSRPFGVLYEGLRTTLEGRAIEGFRPGPEDALSPELRALLLRLLERGEELLRALCEAPRVREALLMPTLAHELGHFFAPGDLNIRDGYAVGWMRHATGPEDNPEGHALECCMYKGRSARFYLDKLEAVLLKGKGRLVLFCDPCRAQLGCGPPGRRSWF